MYYTINKLVISTLLLITVSTIAFAQAIPANATLIDYSIQYDVQADGRYTKEEHAVLRLETPQAVTLYGQLPVSYSSTLQKLDILEAYVIGKDGKRTDVPKDRIMEQQTPQSAGAPMFDDSKVKVIIFPGVEVGSVLHYHARWTQLKPMFPGHFSMVARSHGLFNVESAAIILNAPATLKLYIDAVKMKGGIINKADDEGKQNWRWEIKNLKAAPTETGSVALQDVLPRIAITTFASDQEAAKAYLNRALPKAAVTPGIKELAEKITKGITGRRAQAEAIYHWVSTNIRFVAIAIDVGGVVPHAADEIAKVRYGDCKDHTTILMALLTARGISSNPVLVNADFVFWKPAVASLPGVYNHVILHIPEFDVYLDSTAQFASFGTLKMPLRGKSALVADVKGQAKVVTLPLAVPEQNQVHKAMKLVIKANGTLIGHADVKSRGIWAGVFRDLSANLPQGEEAQIAAEVLAKTGQNGSGSFTRGNPHDLTKPHRFSTDFTLPNYLQLPGPGAFVVPYGVANGIATLILEYQKLPQRTLPMPLVGQRIEEIITLQLPETLKLTALPRSVELQWSYGSYVSKVKAEGSTVTINRLLVIDMPEPLLQPEDYAEFHTFGQAVIRNLRSQLIY